MNLAQVQMPIHDRGDCNESWGIITDQKFCTSVVNGIDRCHSDSGSSVIRSGVQVGIVSFGSIYCGDGTAPAVHVRVEAPLVRNFIRQVAGI